ncbi:biotin--[acetyl-CoA-carboxylase] ligase [Desulfomonile tiedjei]|uniref:biotin--[biotin carboxyl-carrier protein] ligase n=1 Tax=Desulfomonile tiedjei (strain ATCC 49306 / DSM 6799 / DCB-1) TaxID=706587 RepID=I4C9T7_DESTA|nr:biotin--[acetyl-CoA-carboxylase] ligase [Desulfomonile tiedjei]AFM26328.1 birA, biotin-(acetyl-CoA-carboxylase) ligase [Desulfomonile tiedjei DSM 6799]
MFGNLIIYESLGSTQDIARELARQGDSEGTAILALKQTSGRGRLGRTWVSPPGKNLALSVILKPHIEPQHASLLGMAASIATAETVESYGIARAELKWPNDVLVNGRKIAGILSEAAVTSNRLEYVIVGLGLNVNCSPDDFPPDLRELVTSMAICTGQISDVEEIARVFLDKMHSLYDRVRTEGPAFIPNSWDGRWAHRKSYVIRDGIRYRAEAIAPDGALVVSTEDGTIKQLVSGTIEIVSP